MSKTDFAPEPKFIPPYEGNNLIGHILSEVMKLYPEHQEIKSITNVRDFTIIITNERIYRVRPEYQIGWCIEQLAVI